MGRHFQVEGRSLTIQLLEDARQYVLHGLSDEDTAAWSFALKDKVTLQGDDWTVIRSVLNLHKSICEDNEAALCISLTNVGGDEVASFEFDPCTESVKSFWNVIVDLSGASGPVTLVGP